MAEYNCQNSSFSLPEERQPRNPQTSAIGNQGRRNVDANEAGGRGRQRRRGMGVEQLERLRIGTAATSAPAPPPLPVNFPVNGTGRGVTVPLHVGPNFGSFAATSGGFTPPPANFSAPGERSQTWKDFDFDLCSNGIFPNANPCEICSKKNEIFFAQNNVVHKGVNGDHSSSAFKTFVGSNVGMNNKNGNGKSPIFPSHQEAGQKRGSNSFIEPAGFVGSNVGMNNINNGKKTATQIYGKSPNFAATDYMHQSDYAEVATGYKRRIIELENFFPGGPEKRSRTDNTSGGGSTSTGGGEESSAVDLALRLFNNY